MCSEEQIFVVKSSPQKSPGAAQKSRCHRNSTVCIQTCAWEPGPECRFVRISRVMDVREALTFMQDFVRLTEADTPPPLQLQDRKLVVRRLPIMHANLPIG